LRISAIDETRSPDQRVNLAKGLKPDGRLVVIDWDPVRLYLEMAEQETKSALRQTLRQFQDADFEVVKILPCPPTRTVSGHPQEPPRQGPRFS